MRCDSHVHIVGPLDRYPQVPFRAYTACVATLDGLRRCAAAQEISRFVIVQPSFYGTDNTVLLESLDILGALGRGVAVVDPATVSSATLADYHRRGVRGLRINLYSTMGQKLAALDASFAATAEIAQSMNWHVEVIAPLGLLADTADTLAQASVPVVIDHYGLYGTSTPDSAEGRTLRDLLRQLHVWMKLSAPYRVSDDPLATRPEPAWLAALLAAGADRCVWGSDWPHTPPHEAQKDGATVLPYRDLHYTAVVDDFVSALGSPTLADRIMRDNPARLYGFADPT